MNDPTKQEKESKTNIFEFLDSNPWIAIPLIIVLGVAVNVLYHRIFDAGEQRQWVQRTFADGEFQISVPASWESSSSGDYWNDPHSNVSMWVKAYAKADSDTTTLPDFRDQRTSAYVSGMELTDVNITHVNVDSTKNSYALDTFMYSTVDEKKVAHRFRHFNFKDHWVEVMAMVVDDNPRRHQETIEPVIDSIRPTR